jgi:hypothetical protein
MHDLEYSIGIGCWLAVAYCGAVYNLGRIDPLVMAASPLLTICGVFLVITLVRCIISGLLWILKVMFAPDVIMFVIVSSLTVLFGYITKETVELTRIPPEVD